MAFSSSRAFGRALMAAAKTTVAAAAPSATKAAATPATAKSTTTKAAATSTKPPGPPRGFTVPKPISPALAEFLGSRKASRTDAVKGIWDYIKTRGLQNPENKREIICDDKLKALFGKDKVGFLEIAKLLGAHFPKTD